MNPKHFRYNSALGINGLFIVAENEFKAFLRNKGVIISQMLTPILYYMFIVLGINSFVGKVKFDNLIVDYSSYALTGILGLLIIGQMSQTIYRVTIDKRFGLLALKMQSGVSPIFYIIGMSIYPIIGLVIQSIVLFIVYKLFGGTIGIGNYFFTILMAIIILLFWTSIAVIITMRITNYQLRDNIIAFIITPLGFTAPAFYIISQVPLLIKIIGYVNPLTYQLFALRSISFSSPNYMYILIVILITLFILIIASHILNKAPIVLTER